ncbi:small ubiquitin-related modifier 1-like [Silene latifolia]|uniref:small ubiquitin-related modifier 1-like n=1 Tax=Silene latifolia TaxID=37657 RepID=UPI003D77AC7E
MSGTQEKDNKQGEQATHVVLKVLGEEGDKVLIRMKRSSQFKKLMDLYCDRQSVDFWSIAFFFNTRQLTPNLTPDEDGDVIDAFFKMPHRRRN